MVKAAITGNIGSGKSTVTEIFKTLGVPVFVADVEAKKLYELDEVKKQVRDLFGSRVFDKNGVLVRQELANIIFNDPVALRKVNEIIHPKTLARYHNWLKVHKSSPYTLHESAILFENKLRHHFDVVINVSAPFEIRLQRVVERDGLQEEEVIGRMKNQMGDDEKDNLADFVIVNDGKSFLIPQIMGIHEKLKNY